jgi:hypothetical protein
VRATILDREVYTEAAAAVEEREQAASQQASALADRLPTAGQFACSWC